MVRDVVADTSPYAVVVEFFYVVVSLWVWDVVAGSDLLAVVVVDVVVSRWLGDVVAGAGPWPLS